MLRLYQHTLNVVRHSPFIGDGNSKSHPELSNASPYGLSFFIPKEDCIAHATKRMGLILEKRFKSTRVRKLASPSYVD